MVKLFHKWRCHVQKRHKVDRYMKHKQTNKFYNSESSLKFSEKIAVIILFLQSFLKLLSLTSTHQQLSINTGLISREMENKLAACYENTYYYNKAESIHEKVHRN